MHGILRVLPVLVLLSACRSTAGVPANERSQHVASKVDSEVATEVTPSQIPRYTRQCLNSSGLAVLAIWSRAKLSAENGDGLGTNPLHDVVVAVFPDGTVVRKIETSTSDHRYETVDLTDVEMKALKNRMRTVALWDVANPPDVVAVSGSMYDVQLVSDGREVHFCITPNDVFSKAGDRWSTDPDYSVSVTGLRELNDLVVSSVQGHPRLSLPDMRFVKIPLAK